MTDVYITLPLRPTSRQVRGYFHISGQNIKLNIGVGCIHITTVGKLYM